MTTTLDKNKKTKGPKGSSKPVEKVKEGSKELPPSAEEHAEDESPSGDNTQDPQSTNGKSDASADDKSQEHKPWLTCLKERFLGIFGKNGEKGEDAPASSKFPKEAVTKAFQEITEALKAGYEAGLNEWQQELTKEKEARESAEKDLNDEKNEHEETKKSLSQKEGELNAKEDELKAKEDELKQITADRDKYKNESLEKSNELEVYKSQISFQPELKDFASKCLTFLQTSLTLRDEAEKLNGLAKEWKGPDSQADQFIQLQMESLRCYALNTKDLNWQEVRELTAEFHILSTTGIVLNTAHLGLHLKELKDHPQPDKELTKIFFSTYFRQLGEASIILAEELALLNPHLLDPNKPEEYKAETFTDLAQKLRQSLLALGCEIDEKTKPLKPYNPKDVDMAEFVTYPADKDNVIARVKTLSITLDGEGNKRSSTYISQKPSE